MEATKEYEVNTEELNLLVIEDSQDDIYLIKLMLEKHSINFKMTVVDESVEFYKQQFDDYDLILLDYNLLDFDGLTAIKHIRKHSKTPVIVLSGTIDQMLGLDLLEAGADDFVDKSILKKLPFAIRKYLSLRKLQQEEVDDKDRSVFFQHVFNNLEDPFFIKDAQGRYIRANKAFQLLYGETDLLDKTDLHFNDKEIASIISKGDDFILENMKNLVSTFEHINDDGIIQSYELTRSPIVFDDNVHGIFGHMREITGKKIKEEQAHSSRRILIQAEEMTGSGSFEYDETLDLITCSKNLMLMIGLKSNTLSLGKLAQFVKKEDQKFFLSNIRKAIAQRNSYRMQHRYDIKGKEGTFEVWLKPRLENDKNHIFYGTVVESTASYKTNLALINLYEERRSEITKELHDNIGQKLQGVSMYLDRVQECPECADQSKKAVKLLFEAMDQLNEIIADNSASQVTDFSLKEAILNLVDHIHEGVKVNLEYKVDEKEFSDYNKLQVYRIFQEALNNISKYSKAENIELKVVQERSIINLKIADDGIGFNALLVEQGNGLSNIVYRVKSCNGLVNIESAENKGTTIDAKMPLK